jgi:hypothetical protein
MMQTLATKIDQCHMARTITKNFDLPGEDNHIYEALFI